MKQIFKTLLFGCLIGMTFVGCSEEVKAEKTFTINFGALEE